MQERKKNLNSERKKERKKTTAHAQKVHIAPECDFCQADVMAIAVCLHSCTLALVCSICQADVMAIAQ
jgi:hypothetical protein